MNLQFISWDDLNAIKENLDQYVSKFALPSNAWIEEELGHSPFLNTKYPMPDIHLDMSQPVDKVHLTDAANVQCGQVLTQPQPSHVNHGQSFSRFLLSVPRLSGQEDCLPVIVPQPLLELCPLSPGAAVTVTGQLRSFNNRSGQGPRLVVSVWKFTAN